MAVNRTKVLEAAQKFLSKGQYDKAIAEYQKLVAEDPRDVRTLLKIGDLHTRRNKPKDAIEVYERVAELYAKQGFFLKAVAVYKQILKLDPSHLDSTLKLAQMYEELALANDALNTYEQAADAFLAQGHTDKALETMQRMIALDGQNVAARIKFAEALSKANRPREAATAFSDGARLLLEQGRIDDYVRVVERQLYHDPENVEIARELSGRYLERNDPKRALAKLQVCFKADPRDIQTLEMLAEAFRQLGQLPKTVSVLKEIARLHAEINADEPRRRTLMRVLELDPSDAEARQALAAAPARVARATQAEPARAATAAARAPEPQSYPSEPPELEEPTEFDEEAELSLEDAEEEDSDALLMVADDSLADQDDGDPNVPALLAEAEGFESNGDYERAERALRDALLLEEESAEIHERLKDIYLATDRRVEAVRELLWLSVAHEEQNLEQAQAYARTAFDLAPHADATRSRLEALGLDLAADGGESAAQDEVVFVDDSGDLEAPRPLSESPAQVAEERSAASVPTFDAFASADPLDLPISPDDFDAAIPRPRSRAARSDISSLLDRPISAEEFDLEVGTPAPEPSYAPEPAPSYASTTEPSYAPEPSYTAPNTLRPAREADDMAALLDAPISPDEFDAPPPRAPREYKRPAYELLDEPVDDFGLSDARFDRSDLHEVDVGAAARVPGEPTGAGRLASEPSAAGRLASEPTGAGRLASEPSTLHVLEDETYDDLLSDDLELSPAQEARTIEPGPQRELAATPEELDRAEAVAATLPEPEVLEGLDDDWSADLPEPTVPAEPIPELIRRSSQATLEAIGRGPETLRPDARVSADDAADFAPESEPAPAVAAPAPVPAPALGAPKAAALVPPAAPPAAVAPAPVQAAVPPAPVPVAQPPARPFEVARAPAPPPKADNALAPEIEEVLGEAEFFASQGLLDEALEVVQEAILIFPNSEPLKARLAEYERAADEKDEAAAKEEELGADDSFDIAQQLASELASVPPPSAHDEMVDVESVFAQFKKGVAAQISEDDTDTHFDLGIAYKEMGLIDDAIGEFELSAKSPKRACIAWTMVGMCHLEKGDANKAVSLFERALSQPLKAAAEELALNYEIGNAYELSGQLSKALSAFERVAARDRTFRGVTGRVEQLKRRGVSASASGATG